MSTLLCLTSADLLHLCHLPCYISSPRFSVRLSAFIQKTLQSALLEFACLCLTFDCLLTILLCLSSWNCELYLIVWLLWTSGLSNLFLASDSSEILWPVVTGPLSGSDLASVKLIRICIVDLDSDVDFHLTLTLLCIGSVIGCDYLDLDLVWLWILDVNYL